MQLSKHQCSFSGGFMGFFHRFKPVLAEFGAVFIFAWLQIYACQATFNPGEVHFSSSYLSAWQEQLAAFLKLKRQSSSIAWRPDCL